MTEQAYRDMINNTVVPESLSQEEQEKCYQPLANFLQENIPERLYRFRECSERHIAAFDQDQLWFSSGDKVNDDFDALLYFDKRKLKKELEGSLASERFKQVLTLVARGEIPDAIKPFVSPEALKQAVVWGGSGMLDLDAVIEHYKGHLTSQLMASRIALIIQGTTKFACFSEAIDSATMWGYYGASSSGFALSYDFREGNYIACNSCPVNEQCSQAKSALLLRVIYDDTRFDPGQYATWLFQQDLLQDMLARQNFLSHYGSLRRAIPCPDLFMNSKVLIHKSCEWKHEREWRLICSCNSAQFNQQQFSYAIKKPTALYLGRKISPTNEKILRHIADEKGIPVYKMAMLEDDPAYKLHPMEC